MAALFAYRLAQIGPITFTLAANDYGFELLSPDPAPLEEALEAGLVTPDNLLHDIPASLNAAELARRQFREIARVAGLIFQGYPGANKSVKQVQASSGLLYDVFARYDPENLLLFQAHREVLERQLERSRLGRTLERIVAGNVTISVSRSVRKNFSIGYGGWRHHWSGQQTPTLVASDSAADVAEDFDDGCMSDVGGRAGLSPE
jgi:ATP-dependent helicase Lhr and Lhr-like helicase